MDRRAMMALWMLPLAYVLVYRIAAQLAWRGIQWGGQLEGSMMLLLGPVVTLLCAVASAVLCVAGHRRAVGALAPARALLMASIALPMLLIGHVYSMGLDGFLRYITSAPVRLAIAYAAILAALPLTALMFGQGPAVAAAAVPDASVAAQSAPPPPAGTGASVGTVILRLVVALVSVGGFLAWGVMFLFIVGMSGFGNSRGNPWVQAMLASPLALLAITFLASVGLFGAAALRVLRIAVVVFTIPFLVYLGANGGVGITIAGCVALFLALWWAMCRGMEARG